MVVSPALIGIAASLFAGALTGLGGLLVVVTGAPDARRQNLLIGFAAGVMISAAVFSLILPAFDIALGAGASFGGATLRVFAAVWIGVVVMSRLGSWAERLAQRGMIPARLGTWPTAPDAQRIALFIAAITLHNLPEGAAVGLGFLSDDPGLGFATMLGIGLQNIPEGMAVAALLASLGWSPARCALGALASGLVEPFGAAVGVTIAGISDAVLPWALGFSAGAMLYVVMAEIIPRTRRAAREAGQVSATPALMAGLALMMVLDVTLS